MENSNKITQLLIAWNNGDNNALELLMNTVFQELRKLALGRLRNERANHSIQATALVNEAYMRLVNWNNVNWQNRAHFFSVAGQIMRNILVDYARQQLAEKRGGEFQRVSLSKIVDLPADQEMDLLVLDDALKALAEIDPEQSCIIEMRYFGGLTIEETAEVLKISVSTVNREWQMARAWLYRRIADGK